MTDDDTLVAAYLRRLRRSARGLPRSRRQELADQVAEHLAEARGHGGPAGLRDALDRLGEPEEIAAAAGGAVTTRPGRLEILAVMLLLIGGLVGLAGGVFGAFAGWAAGVILLWVSPRWRWPAKLLGTLVWPGGLATPVLLMSLAWTSAGWEACATGAGHRAVCSSGGGGFPPQWLAISVTVIAAVAPVAVAVWLLRRARRAPDPDPAPSPRLIGI